MNTCAPKSATWTALPLALGALVFTGFAACTAGIEEPVSTSQDEDKLNPKKVEMLEPFTAISLRQDLPKKPEELPDLKIKVVQEGEGDAIHYGMIGKFEYIGSLADGKVFHSTYAADAGEPELLRLLPPQVPEGVAIGMDGCKIGERRLIEVPAELAFGDQINHQYGVMIPPHSILIFDITLTEIESGLQVGILQAGDESGPALKYGQQATVHYTGVLAKDGTVFDTSEFGEPRAFPIRNPGVIPGWWLGLPGMKVKEKRRIKIPSHLAYGEQGSGPKIGPDEDLIFDVELTQIPQ